ncbi:GNAT family N-acetyltransferase [Rhodococcoides corynebacterioides]|uniref:GNAT family N-acetyltransferase n=1 Tax=Rhodococcoides corynebacterioides TaxID=53972 RepID=UPI00082F713F|nr:GNAT family N-acetyltransferase [Rhodococcus corynebacterioides]MBY6351597.1 GNAT family N-acetyltransferase [Rhodococcus corynebacterioides]MBY6362459.1 GNAT family N-acetyltransferase [Rhodococcus corynebacterioides]
MATIGRATVRDADPTVLYRILRLRTQVFVHEQRIVDDEEIDGRDLEETTTLFWVEENGADGTTEVLATLRLLQDDLPAHVGRVATAQQARGRGLAADLVRAALEHAGTDVAISAQAYLEGWYGRLGFVRTGENYLEAGIDHVPMLFRRP